MRADDLRKGDTFVEYDEATWNGLTHAERKRARRVTVEARIGACVAADRTHIRTSAGDWCIPRVSPVILIGVEKGTTSARKREARERAA